MKNARTPAQQAAIDAFEGAVNRHVAAGKSRPQAVQEAAKEDPERHVEYLLASNPEHMAETIRFCTGRPLSR